MINKKYSVTGVGNAIVDVLTYTEDRFLEANNFFKGSMILISEDEAMNLANLHYEKIRSGGSVANSISSIANFGVKTALIGKIGDDKFGDIFLDELKKNNIDFHCHKKSLPGTTARSYILVSPDGQRTMCTYLGSASDIESEIDENIIASSRILYLEGYLWDEPRTISALKKAIQIAKENQTLIAFTLSDKFCVLRHHEDFLNLIKELNILFTNEAEINALLNTEIIDFDQISKLAEKNNLIIVVTRSEQGAVVFDGKNSGKSYQVSTNPSHNVVDSTGAGDCFAAGFLYGLTQNFSLEKCAKIGNLFAGKIILKLGARFDQEEIASIKNLINK